MTEEQSAGESYRDPVDVSPATEAGRALLDNPYLGSPFGPIGRKLLTKEVRAIEQEAAAIAETRERRRPLNPMWMAFAIDKHVMAYGPSEPIHDEGTCSTDCAGDIARRYADEVTTP